MHGPHHCPKKHHRCMVDIDVEAVWRDVAGKLGWRTWEEEKRGGSPFSGAERFSPPQNPPSSSKAFDFIESLLSIFPVDGAAPPE